MQPEGFHDLVERARGGDRQALESLLALMRPWLEDLAGGSPEPADLAQEASLRAWQRLDQFRGGADDAQTLALFRAWLVRIVRRLGLNTLRDQQAQRRRPPGNLVRLDTSGEEGREPAAAGPAPIAHVAAQEQARMVREALDRLKDDTDRAILQARFFEGQSLRQIAQQMGRNHEDIRQRYHAALRRLERELKGLP
jgi:RNA polymerase sigma factor (sigma-70 family)